MDLPRRVPPQASPRRSPRPIAPKAMEGDENVSPEHAVAAGAASPQRKKVLADRNGGGEREAASAATPQPKPVPSPPSVTGGGAGTYDPKTNYTTPRPDFLRYDPKRSREILLRLERGVEDESSSATSGTQVSEALSYGSSARGSDSECDDEDGDEDEEEEVPARRGGWARRLFLLLVACSLCYIYCTSSTPFPVLLDEAPVDQTMHGDTERGIHRHGQGDSPRNFILVAMMGLAHVCPDVPFGELTCQIGDASSMSVFDLKNDEQESEALVGYFENAQQCSGVVCSGGDDKDDSVGSSHSDGMEEGKPGLFHQEEGEDYSNHSVLHSVSEDELVQSESEQPDAEEGLETEKLDPEPDVWEYENTAVAAKAIGATVKSLWSVMEPHLLHMLACLLVVGFVAAFFKYYYQRSHKVRVPVSQQKPTAPSARVSMLAPHRTAQLPMLSSPQAVKLPMFASEIPVQLSFPKTDPLACPKVPSVDPEKHDQQIQQGDSDNARVSDNNSTMGHGDKGSLRPPMVELLGKFSFVDAGNSSGRSIKGSDLHGGDVAKIEKEIQSPGVRKTRKKENAVEASKMDVTRTPVRRSSRLRNLTSPCDKT